MKVNPDEPMSCDLFEATVLDELYGELTSKVHGAVADHAARCERCGALLRGLRATRAVVALPLATPPAGLEERVVEFIAGENFELGRGARSALSDARRSRPLREPRAMSAMTPRFALAAGVVLLAGGTGLWLHREQGRVPTVSAQGYGLQAASSASAPSSAPQAMAPESIRLAAADPPSEPTPAARGIEAPTAPMRPRAKPSSAELAKATTELALADRNFAATPPPGAPAALGGEPPATRARSTGAGVGDVARGAPAAAAEAVGGPTDSLDRPASRDIPAELRAARQTRDAEGCSAAIPLFERIARGANGTFSGFAALFDSALCHEAIGDYAGARERLEVLARVESYRVRAQQELARIGAQPGR